VDGRIQFEYATCGWGVFESGLKNIRIRVDGAEKSFEAGKEVCHLLYFFLFRSITDRSVF